MTSHRFLVLGSGLFGKRIASNLAKQNKNCRVTLTSRSNIKALERARQIGASGLAFSSTRRGELKRLLERHGPFATVINTTGPWNQESDFETARTVIESGSNYIDIADSVGHHANFCSALDSLAKQHSVVAITGASTCPAVSVAAIRHAVPNPDLVLSVRICVSGAFNTKFGVGTVQSILGTAGQQYERLENQQPTIATAWRDLEWHGFRGASERRLVANVITPELNLLNERNFSSLKSARVKAGVGHVVPPLACWALSCMPRSFVSSRFFLESICPRLTSVHHWLTEHSNGNPNKVGLMKVSILSRQTDDGSPVVKEWTLQGRDNAGIEVPCAPAVLLARKLANQEIDTGAYDFAPSKQLLSLDEIENYLRTHFHDTITTSLHTRPFESPFTNVMGSREVNQVDKVLFKSHATGGVFDGELEVIAPTSFASNPVTSSLCLYARMPPSTNGSRVPVHVNIEPVVARNPGSASDEIWFQRKFAGRRFVSCWSVENGTIAESFRADQTFGVDVRPNGSKRGFFLDGRALFPAPLQRSFGKYNLTFDSDCYMDDQEQSLMKLDVGALSSRF